MTHIHFVKKACKDNPAVKKGEPYYWWKFPSPYETLQRCVESYVKAISAEE